MRIGVAGVGRMGAFHARSLQAIAGVDVVVADAHLATAQAIAGELGCQLVQRPEALVDAGIDGLVVAAATPAHASLVELGARAGIAVFCEKPITLDLPGTDHVLATIAATGVELQMGFQRRFDAAFLAARDLVASGALGVLHVVRSCTHDPAPPTVDYLRGSGGIFRDCLIHDIDVLRFVTGDEVASVQALGSTLVEPAIAEFGDVDCTIVAATMRSGAVVALTATRQNGAGYDVRMELTGSLDNVAVGHDERLPMRSLEPGAAGALPAARHQDFLTRFEQAYRAEIAAFVEVAAGRAPSPCTGADARAALVVAEACEQSLRERRIVELPELAGSGSAGGTT